MKFGKGGGAAVECESCNNYVFDEEYNEYVCEAYFDEDELARLRLDAKAPCPYWKSNDEYRTVRRQAFLHQ